MSSFIHSHKHFQVIAQGLKQCRENRRNPQSHFFWLALPYKLIDVLESIGINGFINQIAALNVRSFNTQYGTRRPIFQVPDADISEIDYIEWFKAIQSLLYQIENPKSNKVAFELLNELEATIAKRYIMLISEYEQYKWAH